MKYYKDIFTPDGRKEAITVIWKNDRGRWFWFNNWLGALDSRQQWVESSPEARKIKELDLICITEEEAFLEML